MIFHLHQRSEEIRSHLEKIDRILLTSRSVAHLAEQVIHVLQNECDLVAARILFHPNHPVLSVFRGAQSRGIGILPPDLIDREALFTGDPFIIDDPTGDLAYTLFGDSAHSVSSAVVANLSPDDHELGLLCLGSDDPHRYCGGMNTDLIAAMAEKISLGILNAWDHETHVRNTLAGPIDGLYTEPFFMEYVHKELNRAWRTQRPFSILAVSWQSLPGCDSPLREEVHEFFLDNLRSADLVALGQTVDLWIVLPETDQQTAQTVAQRLASLSEEYFSEEFHVCFGITTFSRHAAVAWVMLEQARNALSAARHNPGARIVTQAVTPGLPSG